MKVFMLGWEFPPYNVGGLGIACEGMAKSFVKQGLDVTFVMPNAPKNAKSDFLNLVVASHHPKIDEHISKECIKTIKVDALLQPYMTSKSYAEIKEQITKQNIVNDFSQANENSQEFSLDSQYGNNLFNEVWRYAQRVKHIAKKESFDVIHAHDWMTFQAGIEPKQTSGKPLVVHIHNTAYDRSGGNPSQYEYNLEMDGFNAADKIIAISNFVKNTLTTKYNISSEKIEVVHNGIDVEQYSHIPTQAKLKQKDKVVLFAGRVTLQKGPDYFVKAAHRVSQKVKNVKFVLAGSGDMLNASINMAAELGLSNKFIFPGRYSREQGMQLMSMADVFVMPSVSEPFGLVPLEAMLQKTPTIISKQSGVSEVLANTLKTDFWDIDQLANKIVSVLNYNALNEQLSEYGHVEAQNMTWDPAAAKCGAVFRSVLNH